MAVHDVQRWVGHHSSAIMLSCLPNPLTCVYVCVERASEPWYVSRQGETEAVNERQRQKKHSMDPLQLMQEARKRMHPHTQPAALSSSSHTSGIPRQSKSTHTEEGTSQAEQGKAEEPKAKRHKGSKEVSTTQPLPKCGVIPPSLTPRGLVYSHRNTRNDESTANTGSTRITRSTQVHQHQQWFCQEVRAWKSCNRRG